MMKKKLAVLALALGACGTALATDVGVSVSVVQPGVYGRVDIGAAPPPPVVYAQPMIITQPQVVRHQQPVYLYVPVEQQRHWGRYCGRYGACSRPVYFVQDNWYHQHVDRRDERREDRRDDWRDDDRGRGGPPDGGPGHGHGHGKGHGRH